MVSNEGINLRQEAGNFSIPSGIRDLYCTQVKVATANEYTLLDNFLA